MARAGAKVIRDRGKEYWGGIISTFEDPDGNYFQLIEFSPDSPRQRLLSTRGCDAPTACSRSSSSCAAAASRRPRGSRAAGGLGAHGLSRHPRPRRSRACRSRARPASATCCASGFDLPPLMFTEAEIEALVLGARVVRAGATPDGEGSRDALARVEAALPDRLRERAHSTRLYAPGFHVPHGGRSGSSRTCAGPWTTRRKVLLAYTSRAGDETDRTGAAARAVLLGHHLVAHRVVRATRRLPQLPSRPHARATALDPRFEDEAGKTMDDFFRKVDEEE